MRDCREAVFYYIKLGGDRGFTYARSRVAAAGPLGVDGIRISCPCDKVDPSRPDEAYGTAEDFIAFAEECKKNGLALIMDFPIAWTDKSCELFAEAASDPASQARDCYFFRSGSAGHQPNNWANVFGKSAWKPQEDGSFSLSLLSNNTRDLDWENPKVMQWAVKTLRTWQERGAGGFCLIGVDLMFKPPELPDYEGQRRFTLRFPEELVCGRPKCHGYLQELGRKLFSRRKGFFIGEGLFIEPEDAAAYTDLETPELSAVCLAAPAEKKRLNLREYKEELLAWQSASQQNGAWLMNGAAACGVPGIPGSDYSPSAETQKALLMLVATMRGTPVIADGEEADAAYCRKLIELRRKYPELVEGEFTPFCTAHKQAVVYQRGSGAVRLLMMINLSSRKARLDVSETKIPNGVLLLGTHRIIGFEHNITLLPWEGRIYLIR